MIPMILIAIIVRLNSKGPALYWSDRVGKNNVIFNKIDWGDFDAWNDSYIGTYFENGRELDFDKVATDLTISEMQNYGPDTIREITSVKITKVDIPSIEMFIYDQEINHPFKFKKSHQKYILIFLMCIYRKDLAEQINQTIGKSSEIK